MNVVSINDRSEQNALELKRDQLEQELQVKRDKEREAKKLAVELKVKHINAQKNDKAALKVDLDNANAAHRILKDEIETLEEKLDGVLVAIAQLNSGEASVHKQKQTVTNVQKALENLNAYYITTERKWHCVYTDGVRHEPICRAYDNETMKDIILGETGWSETNELTVKKIAQESGRMYRNVERTFQEQKKSVLNQMNELRKFWLKPIYGQRHHEAFDLLLLNVCGGKTDYKEHLEKYIAYRYVKPNDLFVPNIDSCAKGGTGRDTLFHILEIIFTQECCGEANGETFTGTHNGELWGKVWVKISERNSKSIDYNEFKNLTGGHNFRLRRMGENAVQAPRTFVFFIMNNGYHSTIPVTGNGSSSEDRRVEPIFSNTSLLERIADYYNLTEEERKNSLGSIIQSLQDNVFQNEEEIAKWLGNIIEKHQPEKIDKFMPLHGDYYQLKIDRQKNAFNTFMDTVISLSQHSNCYAVDDMHKIYEIVSGQHMRKDIFGKKMSEWLIGKSGKEWEVKVKDIYYSIEDRKDERHRKSVVCVQEDVLTGRPSTGDEDRRLTFNIYEFILEDKMDDRGNDLGRKPHPNNIKSDLL